MSSNDKTFYFDIEKNAIGGISNIGSYNDFFNDDNVNLTPEIGDNLYNEKLIELISKQLIFKNEFSDWFSYNASDVDESTDIIDENTYSLIFSTFLNEDYEEGVFKESKTLYDDLSKKYSLDAIAKVYLNIFRNNISDNSNFNVVRTMLNLISDISEYNDTLWSIAHMGISLVDVVSVDLSVACFEKWGHKGNISTLKAINIKEKWLKEYIDEVVYYLESI